MSDRPTPALVVAEPLRLYGTPPVVVDCSGLAALLFDEAGRDVAEQALADQTLPAPWLVDVEIARSPAKKPRRNGKTSPARAWKATSACPSSGMPWTRARYSNWPASASSAPTTPPTCNLPPVCKPPFTFDRKLGNAARAYLGRKGA